VEQYRPDAYRVTRVPCSAERSRSSEKREEQFFEVLVSKPWMPVAGQPPQVGSPDWVRLANQTIVPPDMAARSRCDRSLTPEFLVPSADRAAVSDDHLPFEHSAEQVRYVPHLLLALRPYQLEWLPRDGDNPGIAVRFDDVMAL
jgi:hypothetical protein